MLVHLDSLEKESENWSERGRECELNVWCDVCSMQMSNALICLPLSESLIVFDMPDLRISSFLMC